MYADIQVVFQNSTLVGGVVIGTSADMMINIWGAMIIGGLAGAGSIFINRFSTVSDNLDIMALNFGRLIKFLMACSYFKTKAVHRIIGMRNAWYRSF